jgi:DNA-binding NtrC family response regulator
MTTHPHRHIVVIDDDVEHLLYVTTLLKRAHYDCAGFTNTRSALTYMKQRHVDLVITDLFMPEMDGFETLAAIHNAFPDIAVLMLSGGGPLDEPFYLDCAKHLGAGAVLKKPFEPEALRALVAQTLQYPASTRAKQL